jgi:NADH-quinone oxidoreductase subunit C
MTPEDLHGNLKARFGDAIGTLSEAKIDPFVIVSGTQIVEICRFLKETPGLDFDYCEDVTGVDWPARNVIEVVYHLFSLRHKHGIVLKVETDRSRPALPTVEEVWKAANWLEREVFDLLGVEFLGHSDLRRILLPDDWIGHPLRKDYAEAGGYHGVSNTREDMVAGLTRQVQEKRKHAAEAAAAEAAAAEAATAIPPLAEGEV